MFGTYFYHKRVRSAVSVFGSLFNNLYVLRKNSAGETISQVKVPLSYAPKRNFIARLESMNSGEQAERRVAIKLPRMSFEITSITYDETRQLNKMNNIKPSQAVNHPKWKMGKKISIDSATLMNKIFEVIEANKLFAIDLRKIEILIHPQSLVHAIVKLKNGLNIFLYFETDMSIPIGNEIFENKFEFKKIKNIKNKFKKNEYSNNLNFFKVNKIKFPAIKLKPILNKYHSLPIILNAANEIFVDQFLKKNMSFCSIIDYLFYLLKDPKMRKYAIKKPSNLKTILSIDKWTRNKAIKIINKNK